MSSFTQICYHIVFSTKHRRPTLQGEEKRPELFRYIWGIIKNQKGHLYRINGVEDHVHILTSIRPTIALSNFVKDVKIASSIWVKEKGLFPAFTGWQLGYGGFGHSVEEIPGLIEYIKGQQEHHRTVTFEEEYRRLLKKAGIAFDEKYLFEDEDESEEKEKDR
jgi:putative transposase